MKRAMTPLMNGSRHDDHCPEGTVANHLRHAMFVGLSTLSTRENCREVGMTFRLWKGKYISVRWSSVCCQFSAQLRIIPGTLEAAQHIANHESPRTTKLYDRRQDEISLDEVEKIGI
jgi:hypothetical protein